jgi:hypothetical protein
MQKTAVTVRITSSVYNTLRQCALRERRSNSNMIEVMIIEYGKRIGVEENEAEPGSEDAKKAI